MSSEIEKTSVKTHVSNATLVAFGWLSLAAGIIGIFLPLLPTTPFLLLSAWLFSKGSPTLHAWLLNHSHLGPILRQWEEQRSLDRKIKLRAIAVVIVSFGLTLLLLELGLLVRIALVALAMFVCAFLYRLPESGQARVDNL